jgi:phage head maturation protease
MDRIFCPFELKSDNSNDGIITGYGSVFGNVGSYGDTVAKGAFKKT